MTEHELTITGRGGPGTHGLCTCGWGMLTTLVGKNRKQYLRAEHEKHLLQMKKWQALEEGSQCSR